MRVDSLKFKVCSSTFKVHTFRFTFHFLHFTLYRSLFTVHGLLFTVYCSLFTLHQPSSHLTKIIAVSDIHGAYESVQRILLKEPLFDALILAGDLTTNGSPREAEDALKLFRQIGKPIVSVAGNMDPLTLEPTFESMTSYVNGRGIVIDKVGFCGVSGSPVTPMNTPYELPEETIRQRAESGWKDLELARWKIFIPHAPPYNTAVDQVLSGTHVGSKAVRSFIEQHQPDVVVCGHIHEARGKDTIGNSQIVNCGPAGKGYYVVITIDIQITVEVRE